MVRQMLPAVGLGFVFAVTIPVGAQAPAANRDLKDNAALKYWQAFGLLPRPDKARAKVLDDWKSVPLDAAALKVIEDSKEALIYLHRAAQIGPCDWGLSLEDGPGTLMPHLSKARELMHVALFRARYEFETGKFQPAVDDVADTLALARHTGSGGMFLSVLVQNAIEVSALELAARYLPDVDAAALKRLAERVDGLPAGATPRSALRVEKEYCPPALMQQLKQSSFPGDQALQAILAAAGGPKGPAKLLQGMGPYYDEMDRLLALPPEPFKEGVAELNKKAAANPFAKLLLPALEKVYEADQRMRAKKAMFRAALAVLQGGRERLKDYPDPFGTGPFEYRALGKGFELRSKLIHLGNPVTLQVGPPAAG